MKAAIDTLELDYAIGEWAQEQLRAGKSHEQVAAAIQQSAEGLAQEVLDGEHD